MIEKRERIAFYETEIARIKWVIDEIKLKGEKALHELDKPKGKDRALEILNEQLEYFKKQKKDLLMEVENGK